MTAFRGADAVEQVIRGYTGSMGVSFLGVLDALGRGEGLYPDRPQGPFGGLPALSAALTDELGSMYKVGPDRANRWVGKFYEMSREINQAYRKIQSKAAAGEVAEARRLAVDGNVGGDCS